MCVCEYLAGCSSTQIKCVCKCAATSETCQINWSSYTWHSLSFASPIQNLGTTICFCLLYGVPYRITEFIYLISFHVQIENQYHFRSIVCAAGKLERRLEIANYMTEREREREKKDTDIDSFFDVLGVSIYNIVYILCMYMCHAIKNDCVLLVA